MRFDRDGWIHGDPLTDEESVTRILDHFIKVKFHVDGTWSVSFVDELGNPQTWMVNDSIHGASGRGPTIGTALDDLFRGCPWAYPDPPACQPHRLKAVPKEKEE